MIDPTTQLIIYKDMQRELLLEIELRQGRAERQQHVLAQPWYTRVANWLTQAFLHIAPGKRDVGKDLSSQTCCNPAGACSCSCS